jgi:hypothetical protein
MLWSRRLWSRRALSRLGVLVLAWILSAAPGSAQPREPVPELVLTLEGDEVLATAVTPEGTLALTYLNRTLDAFGARVEMGTELLTDDDGDGEVRFVPEGGIARVSSWVAVDLSEGDGGGRAAQASPRGFSARPIVLPPQALERGANGRLQRLRRDGQIFYTALLRSGDATRRGAWSLFLEDGGEADGDGRADQRVLFQPEDGVPVGTSPVAPAELEGGDVIVMAQPRHFTLTILQVRETGPPRDLTLDLLGRSSTADSAAGEAH